MNLLLSVNGIGIFRNPTSLVVNDTRKHRIEPRTIRALISVFVSVCTGSTFGSETIDNACSVLALFDAGVLPKFETIETAGQYCVDFDVYQPRIWSGHTLTQITKRDRPYVFIASSNVHLDLRDHTLVSDSVMRSGIKSSPLSWDDEHRTSGISIANGVLRFPGEFRVVSMPSYVPPVSIESDLLDRRYPKRTWTGASSLADTTKHARQANLRMGFNSADNSLINLEIMGGSIGVLMRGAGNRIRDSKIIVNDSYSGAYLMGPNLLIENNIFIFSGIGRSESAAPVKLDFADGAIIRNNIFIIEDNDLAPKQAISLIESPSVSITGNRVYGDAVLVRKYDELTTTVESDNRIFPLSERPLIAESVRAASQVQFDRRSR